ncbi:hypothetical protein EPO34_01045 [Patescibacteria group bacterium]|nr:MAG: hypothetical protein EPO34_01045 [Patescibacteria group bacterium]
MNRGAAAILLGSLLAGFFPTAPARAQAYVDPNELLSDREMTDSTAMSLSDIEAFLDRGTLGTYRTRDLDGVMRSAADIIWNAAQEFSLSPRFLLALLQREQSLVEDPFPSRDQLDWAMGYAVCDDCAKDDSSIQKYRGFAPQVHYAAQRIRESFLADVEVFGRTLSGFGPGLVSRVDGRAIMPANAATAALYTYTPHLHGNEVFVRVWERWFGSGGPREQIANYSLVRSPRGTVFLLVGDMRRGFPSREVLRAHGFVPDEIQDVSFAMLDSYREGPPVGFPDGTLVRSSVDPTVYVVSEGARRPILNERAFLSHGWRWDDILWTDTRALAVQPLGEPMGVLTLSGASL